MARRADEAASNSNLESRSLDIARALTKLQLGLQTKDPTMWTSATKELAESGDIELEPIARAAGLVCSASDAGSLDLLCQALTEAAKVSHSRGRIRHEGISLSNLSYTESNRGNHVAAVLAGQAALALLQKCGDVNDIAAARLNSARGLAHLGRWHEAKEHITAAMATTEWVEPDLIAESVDLEATYGDPTRALEILQGVASDYAGRTDGSYLSYATARIELQRGDPCRAAAVRSNLTPHGLAPGFRSAITSLDLQIRAAADALDPELGPDLEAGISLAERQQAWFWSKTIRLTRALVADSAELSSYVRSLGGHDAAYLSIQAELVVRRLADLDEDAIGVVRREAELRPERWRWALRQVLLKVDARPGDIRRNAQLLDEVGDATDIKLLRKLAHRKSLRIPDAGRALARRVAPQAFIDELGRVTIQLGGRVIAGTDVRKKVLSLLTFLLTRPQFSASREQVIEALWPEMEPEAGANSLNQTSYFLRQILEPKTDDDSSAGYLNSRADLIWLDPRLVRSRSSECLQLISAIRKDPAPALISKLAESYTGRFAVDFMYDDWASTFRDGLHASYLDRIERAIAADMHAGALERALSVAQLAMQADPDAEQIELCLLRLYRRMGANAAAAEQYAHYASVMREQLGVEPPPLESI
jgi:DNA-binding SARP family transcriptional activator